MSSPDPKWFVTRAHPGQEIAAKIWLQQLHRIEVFLPMASRRVLSRNRLVPRRTALFPGYLFTRFVMSFEAWAKVRATPGVYNVMKGAGVELPQWLDDDVVEYIREQHVDGVLPLADGYTFKKGETIRAVDGRYRDLSLLFVSCAGERVRALLTLFNRQAEVELPLSSVARLAS